MNTYICDCGQEYTPDPKYIDTRVKCNVCIKRTKARNVKRAAVKYLGGQCMHCQFRGHYVAFDFDHKDPSHKSFKISGHAILRWSELQKELDKCNLLCSNCHRIKHM